MSVILRGLSGCHFSSVPQAPNYSRSRKCDLTATTASAPIDIDTNASDVQCSHTAQDKSDDDHWPQMASAAQTAQDITTSAMSQVGMWT